VFDRGVRRRSPGGRIVMQIEGVGCGVSLHCCDAKIAMLPSFAYVPA
jgi:hypothetical protein